MSAPVGYPVHCLSAYCGRICCDGCGLRPVLAAYHARRGTSADFEDGQQRARALEAKWAAERAAERAAAEAAP